MHWIRFDKQLPPEDTTVTVSNGPAMGTYHYRNESFFNPEHQVSIITLWELSGKRVECEVGKIIQWCPILKSDLKRTPLMVKKSLWQQIKEWMRI